MSGVIDDKGQQWERCTMPGERHYVKFPDLAFNVQPCKVMPHGGTVCVGCVATLRRQGVQLKDIKPYVPANFKLGKIEAR